MDCLGILNMKESLLAFLMMFQHSFEISLQVSAQWILEMPTSMHTLNSISFSRLQCWSRILPLCFHGFHSTQLPYSSQTEHHSHFDSSFSKVPFHLGFYWRVEVWRVIVGILHDYFGRLCWDWNLDKDFYFLGTQAVMAKCYFLHLSLNRLSLAFLRSWLYLVIWDKNENYTEVLLGKKFSLFDGKYCKFDAPRWLSCICGVSLGEYDLFGVTWLLLLMKKWSISFIRLGWNMILKFR